MRKSRFLALVLVSSLLLMSLGLFTTQAQEGDESVLRMGLASLTTIDPALGADDSEIMFNQLQYDYLIDILPDGELAPSLATDWTVSDDGLTYTFNLREGVTFEDGSSFDAQDVVFTFNRLVERGSSIVSLLGQRETGETDDEGNPITEPTWSVEAQDELTAVFTLDEPNADFLFGVASRFSMILSSESENINQIAEGDDPYVNFNGTGPFILTNYQPDESATFVANDNYWEEGAPILDGVELIFFDDDQSQVDALLSGAVDFIIKIPTDLQGSIEDAGGFVLTQKATNIHPVIRLRADEGSIGEDVRIREALKLATDRELLNLDALNGQGTVANNDPIGPTFGSLYEDLEERPYDPARACELIAEVAADEAGNGFINTSGSEPRLEAQFFIGDTFEYALLAEFAQQQWSEGCIDVELNVVPLNVYYSEGENNWLNAQFALTAWGTRPTPQEYLSVAYTTGAPFNESHWSNEELDQLAQEASVTSDIEQRAAIYNEIRQVFFDSGPIVVPYFRPVAGAYADTIEGLNMHSFPGRTDMSTVSFGGSN